MRNSIFILLLFILLSNQSIGQTTSFKDNRWFDYKKNPSNFYSKPIHEPAEVIVSQDSIIAHLGSNIIRYKIKSVSDIDTKNKSTREYKVEKNGAEVTVSITRSKETYFGKERRIAWIGGGEDGWIVMAPLTSITPLGYLFPGDPKIDIAAERARIVGYYDYELVRSVDAEAYRRAGASSYHLLIWTDDKCKKDLQIELRPDNTGTWWVGHTAKNCTNKSEQNFKWKLEHVVVEGRQTMMLTLTGDETNQYMVEELTDKKLSLGGQFRVKDDDTTSDGYLVLSKKKKK